MYFEVKHDYSTVYNFVKSTVQSIRMRERERERKFVCACVLICELDINFKMSL